MSSTQLSVVIPVYNEAQTISEVVSRLRAIPLTLEIIAVNDCSTDDTGSVLDRLRASGEIDIVVHHEVNQGKGAALRHGFEHASGLVIVVQDADLEYDPAELPRLYRFIESGKADAVFGSRLLGGDGHRVLYYWHSVGNRLLTLVSNMMTNINLTDMETCYKMVKGPLMKSLPLSSNRFGFEPEVTARLAQFGARIYEVPITYSGRTYAEGKKIGWKDGVAAFWHILYFNLLSRPAPSRVRLAKAERSPARFSSIAPPTPHSEPVRESTT